jgi:hypothetical protein
LFGVGHITSGSGPCLDGLSRTLARTIAGRFNQLAGFFYGGRGSLGVGGSRLPADLTFYDSQLTPGCSGTCLLRRIAGSGRSFVGVSAALRPKSGWWR